MKKDFLIIMVLLVLAVVGVYVSCTGTETDKIGENKINTTILITPGRDTINAALLVATNDDRPARGCPCPRPRNFEKCKATTEGCKLWSSWKGSADCVSLHLETCI